MNDSTPSPGAPRTGRRLALGLALASLALACVSVPLMALRIAHFRRTDGRTLYVFQPVADRGFVYAGRPVTILDRPEPDGGVTVVVHYGERQLELPASLPPGSEQLPGLLRHEDWLRVLRFAERSGMSAREFEEGVAAGRIADRLVLVTRRPVSGPDERSGAVPERDWAFTFHEFLPDGSISTERSFFPTNRPGRAAKPSQLQDGTWQMSAALMLMPPSARPNREFSMGAVRAMGWTLPASGVSLLVLTLSLALWAAPERPRPGRTGTDAV